MDSKKTFYITTTLPYVNADLHIGHALEFIRADAIARYKELAGFDVFFNTGTDEHGMKIYSKAMEAGKAPQDFVDEQFERFKKQVRSFGMLPSLHFIRTTDKRHEKAAQKFWQTVSDKGYIYKKNYKAKYCPGCESEKTESELVNGCCQLHPELPVEIIDEENYFFAFSKFQKPLLDFYGKNPDFVIPNFRYNEVKAFVSRGLQDFSISRLKEKMPWGIPVPGDDTHVMYVWFDALVNYISTLGWGSDDDSDFKKYWVNGTPTQYCGKDNTRFQAVMWQAMLMAADVKNSYQIVVDGHITAGEGIKMSKSLGNVVDPMALSAEYGTDALRLFLLKEISSFEDSPFTSERFKETYNVNLANGLGNLVSRIMTLSEKNCSPVSKDQLPYTIEKSTLIARRLREFDIKAALNDIWEGNISGLDSFMSGNETILELEQKKDSEISIATLDKFISDQEPYKKIKSNSELGRELIEILRVFLYDLGLKLEPFLPDAAKKIQKLVLENKKPDIPLFPRKE